MGAFASRQVVSAALAMVAECRAVNRILKELLSAAGCEIYIRPVPCLLLTPDASGLRVFCGRPDPCLPSS